MVPPTGILWRNIATGEPVVTVGIMITPSGAAPGEADVIIWLGYGFREADSSDFVPGTDELRLYGLEAGVISSDSVK